MLEKRVCDQKESEYEQKKDGVLERKYNDGRSKDMGRRKNTEMKYVETLKKAVFIFGFALFFLDHSSFGFLSFFAGCVFVSLFL